MVKGAMLVGSMDMRVSLSVRVRVTVRVRVRVGASRSGLQCAPASSAAHCRLREVTRAEEGGVCWLADAA